MAKTTNYNLQKDLTTDYYDIDTHNANLDIIDTEMKLIADNSSTLDTKESTVTFAEAVEEADIVTGEKHSTLFGKILKSFKTIKSSMLKPGAPGAIGTAIGDNADMLDGFHAEHFDSQISSLATSVAAINDNLAGVTSSLSGFKVAYKGSIPASAIKTVTLAFNAVVWMATQVYITANGNSFAVGFGGDASAASMPASVNVLAPGGNIAYTIGSTASHYSDIIVTNNCPYEVVFVVYLLVGTSAVVA